MKPMALMLETPFAYDMVVVIPTHGRAPLLRRTLESLDACEKPLSYRETWVVENGPRGGAQEVVADFRATLRARHLHVPTASKTAALNHAIGRLEDELIVFLDDDVRLAPEVLVAYAEAARQASRRSFFGGPFGVDYETPPLPHVRRFLPRSARGWERPAGLAPGREPFLGFNWAAFAPDLRDAGMFDPDRGPGAASGMTVGDESILQRRLIGRGVREVYVPAARVWHYVPKERCSATWLLDRTFRHGMAKGWQRGGERPALLGRPLWIYRRRAQGFVKGLAEWLTFDAERRFRRLHRAAFNRGLWAGAARKHAEDVQARRGQPAAAADQRAARVRKAERELERAHVAGGHR